MFDEMHWECKVFREGISSKKEVKDEEHDALSKSTPPYPPYSLPSSPPHSLPPSHHGKVASNKPLLKLDIKFDFLVYDEVLNARKLDNWIP